MIRMLSSLGTVHDAMIRLCADRVFASTRGSRNNDGVKVLWIQRPSIDDMHCDWIDRLITFIYDTTNDYDCL